MKTARLVALTAALMFGGLQTAQAAQNIGVLGASQGKVLIGTDKGFAAGHKGSELPDGSKILVGEESLTSVAYEGCTVILDKPTLYTVDSQTACNKADASISTMIVPTADVVADPYAAGIPLPVLLFGGAAIITTSVILLDGGKNKNRGPVSGP